MCNLKKKESTRTNDWCMDMDFRLVMANMHAMKLICTRSTVEMLYVFDAVDANMYIKKAAKLS
jgi:hypothetical protein